MKNRTNGRQLLFSAFTLSLLAAQLAFAAAEKPKTGAKLENRFLRLEIGPDGRCSQYGDRRAGVNYSVEPAKDTIASVKKGGEVFQASSALFADGRLTLEFGQANVTATIKVTRKKNYFIFEVAEFRGEGVQEFVFANFPLTLKASLDEPFAACALALNLQTKVNDIPGLSRHLWAACYPRFGFVGAKVALIGCPTKELRRILQEATSDSPDLPHSAVGGPWAMDAEINRGSYLFNFGEMSEAKVDEWIKLAHDLGFTQIDFHGGVSFRFGDCVPNPKTYTNGWASFRAVIDKLHAAGIQAGLHTYAEFIDKNTPWVTPVPDSRLGKFATYTLSKPMTTTATNVLVNESTTNVSLIRGWPLRNSATIQVDDELIIFDGVSKEPPYAFTQCRRGAHGTKVTDHQPGAKVHHLKECFGLFVPDGDSTLFTEVAAKTAEAFNAGGFDMIYLDALDGSDIVAGAENAWYYHSKFTFEIWKRLKKPALMEMSTFSHHLWFVRSRGGAWDHPNRGYKRFVDIHAQANDGLASSFLPQHLGWWRIKKWGTIQDEPTYADDMEYLCGKCIGLDCGFSLMGVNPGELDKVPAFKVQADIMRQYEQLRHANYFDAKTKAMLAEPGKEFTLVQDGKDRWRFRPVIVDRHRVENLEEWSRRWTVKNPFGAQPVRLRIEALSGVAAYDGKEARTAVDFANLADFSERSANKEVTMDIRPGTEQVKPDLASALFTATNAGATRTNSWAKIGRNFEPLLNLKDREALGLWVHGDGKGEVLNVQLMNPYHIGVGVGDHYIPVDFKGWRYFELVEPEAERWSHYQWPYGHGYAISREEIHYGSIKTVSFWFNNIPPGETVTCQVSPVRGLSVFANKFKNPAVTIGGRELVFPVELETGSYIEFNSLDDCKHYNKEGGLVGNVKPQGDVPSLAAGENRVEFGCEAMSKLSTRARVTVIAQGDMVGGGKMKRGRK